MNKTEVLDDSTLIKLMKALADPTRFRMVQEISASGELSCGEVAKLFDITQPAISRHLRILTDAGLLLVRKEGKFHITSVNKPLLAGLGELIPARIAAVNPAARKARKEA